MGSVLAVIVFHFGSLSLTYILVCVVLLFFYRPNCIMWWQLKTKACSEVLLLAYLFYHRRRSSVNFRGARHFCPKKYV